MAQQSNVEQILRDYLIETFLPGEDPNELKNDTPLITAGILDSVATLKLVAFLEERFNIQIDAHEADAEHLNTIADIARLIGSKG
jgi:acyl carrier protein